MPRLLSLFVVLVLGISIISTSAAPAEVILDVAASTREIDGRLAKQSPDIPPNSLLFAVADLERGTKFSRNTILWCVDLAPFLTCFSPWNSHQGAYQGGTLITPKHALFAEHFSGRSGSNTLLAGEQVLFVGSSNILYKRTLKDTPMRVPGTDFCVGTFKENDLPPDVLPAQVLPAGLKDDAIPAGTPVLFCNKNKQANVGELVSLTGVVIRPATASNRTHWTLGGPAFVGDSGSPIFLAVNGRLVLLTLFSAPNAGLSISTNIDKINELLGRGYALDVMKIKKP